MTAAPVDGQAQVPPGARVIKDTLFTRARNLERALGVGKIFLKFEGSNPSGTQKDRVAVAAYADAHEKGFDIVTLATCGNFGAAIAEACSHNGIRPVIFIPTQYHTPRVAEMERLGGRIVRVPGDYEAAVEASRRAAEAHGWYDANPGGREQWDLSRRAYGGIGREIVNALGDLPDSISVSVGNGTTLAGVYEGVKEVVHRGGFDPSRWTRGMPRMIAASTPRGNPIVKSWKAGSRTCTDLSREEIRETTVNEPLVNWHSFDGQRALDVIWETNGYAEYATDRDMVRAAKLIRELEGVNALTASSAALVALEKTAKARAEDGDVDWLDGTHVVVLTGRSIPRTRHSRAGQAAAGGAFLALSNARAPGLVAGPPRRLKDG